MMLVRVDSPGNQAVTAYNRNGYPSAGAASGATRIITELLYWDNGPKRMQPSLGLGPEPYDWSD